MLAVHVRPAPKSSGSNESSIVVSITMVAPSSIVGGLLVAIIGASFVLSTDKTNVPDAVVALSSPPSAIVKSNSVPARGPL